MRRRPFGRALAAAAASLAAVIATGAVQTAPAAADLAQPRSVQSNPVDFTPHVLDGTVWDVALVGGTVVVAGDFSEVSDAAGKVFYDRENLFAFDLASGAVLPLRVDVDAPIYAVVGSPDGATVYIGGAFRKVNGAAQRGLARLAIGTGVRDASFTANINWGDSRELAISGGWLYAGGAFSAVNGLPRVGLVRMNPANGVPDAWDPRIAAPGLSRARVEDFAVSPNGTRLVAIGAIQQVAGQRRTQIAMFDLTTNPPTLSPWTTDAFAPPCRAGFDTYLRGIDFAPDSSYFVTVTTGRASHPNKLCDTAARFNTAGVGSQRPVWVNHTGGDSLYAVSVTGAAVYVGGHQRWLNNPYGRENAGKGAVSRKGIGAIDPVTGLATPFDPTRDRGVGVRAMLATPNGLLVGSDTERLGREYHGRIGMFPL